MYFYVQIVVIFKPQQILYRNLLHMWPESHCVKAVNVVKKSITVTEIMFVFISAPCSYVVR